MARKSRAYRISRARGQLYSSARSLGDVQAVSQGPDATAKRVVRRLVLRQVSKTLWKIL